MAVPEVAAFGTAFFLCCAYSCNVWLLRRRSSSSITISAAYPSATTVFRFIIIQLARRSRCLFYRHPHSGPYTFGARALRPGAEQVEGLDYRADVPSADRLRSSSLCGDRGSKQITRMRWLGGSAADAHE